MRMDCGGREAMKRDSSGSPTTRAEFGMMLEWARRVAIFLLLVFALTGCGDEEPVSRDGAPMAGVSPPRERAGGSAIETVADSARDTRADSKGSPKEGSESSGQRPLAHSLPRGLTELPKELSGAKGRYRERRNVRVPGGERDLTPEQIEELERLSAIGYVSGSVPSTGFRNVTVFDEERAESGLNFFLSGHGAEAALADMEGNVLHRWKVDFSDVWPELERKSRLEWTRFIRRAHLFENGDILAIWDSVGIAKIDKDSKVIWARPNMAHHDLQVMPNGDIYLLTSKVGMIERINAKKPVRDDAVTRLDSEGNIKQSVSILEAYEKSEKYRGLWEERASRAGELFHTNTLEVLDGSIEADMPEFKSGNVLTSMLLTDTIAVIDLERGEVVWAWGDGFHAQHDPRILPSGNLLLFDNHDEYQKSSVEEYDPRTMELVWSYRGSENEPFYSRTCGSAQRLPGGNTLVTESDNGRAFEITPEGEIVWEFFNPHLAGENDEFIAVLLELQRLPADFPISWAHGVDR
jgi:outer membrane protein assembly factor BamB